MKRFLWSAVLIIIAFFALYIYWFYYNVYSDGERKGTLVKVSEKGNVFKTFEGEMWLSCRQTVNPEKFLFSISDKALADSLSSLQDQCVELDYRQFRKTLPWRGDTEYIIVGFKKSSSN